MPNNAGKSWPEATLTEFLPYLLITRHYCMVINNENKIEDDDLLLKLPERQKQGGAGFGKAHVFITTRMVKALSNNLGLAVS